MSSTPQSIPLSILISSAPTLANARNFTISNASFNDMSRQQINNYSCMHELAKYVAHGAFHDSSVRYPPPKCHPGTREKVLRRIKDWIEEGTSRILWLFGSAGVGKSAIAQTIAEHCLANDKLGAAFFFRGGDPHRNDADRLFPTLAWQLMSSVPEIEVHISASMKKDPFLPTRSIQTQFEQLIAKPFRLAAGNNSPLRTSGIVIIDGVDECAGETTQQCFLSLLGSAVDNGGLPLRLLICSRPEPHVRETFDHSISVSVTLRIVLNDERDSDDDIRRYLVQEFSRISMERGIASHTWPPEGAIDRLVQNSSGQFIYAATVVKFVGDKYAYPSNQLEIIFKIRRRTNNSSPFVDLDQLYLEILVRQPDQDFLKTFLKFLCLPIDDNSGRFELIRILFNMQREEFLAKIRGLHSLLVISVVSSCNIEAHPYHASFLDFLRDQERACQYHSDGVLGSRNFVDLFLKALIKYASSMWQPSLIPYKDDFNIILHHGICSFTWVLECIAVDKWEQMLAPLQILRNLAFEMSPSRSVQPFEAIYLSIRLLFLSLRGELFTRRKPNSLTRWGISRHCTGDSDPKLSQCSSCNLDIIHYQGSNICLKQLIWECFYCGFSIALHDWRLNSYEMNHSTLYHKRHAFFSDLMAVYDLDG